MDRNGMRIIFMGTPEFAVTSLKKLLDDGQKVVAVITAPDKPSGRGRKIQPSPVKSFAEEKGIPVLQPLKLKDPGFVDELRSYKADLQLVVAFRMLPEVVWKMPEYGTVNLHASLLPDYRGAAPINWAIINGEEKTGVTTFFIEQDIDTGNIIFREEVPILPDETAGDLHDKLMETGAELLLRTVHAIEGNKFSRIQQSNLIRNREIKQAPKIFKEDCRINWSDNINSIYNFIRGLSPYPAAFTELSYKEKVVPVKIFTAEKKVAKHEKPTGAIITDSKTYFEIAVKGGYISIKTLQLAGKNKLGISDFLKGFDSKEPYGLIL
jgi:methionyl-tRNA formyltransferase